MSVLLKITGKLRSQYYLHLLTQPCNWYSSNWFYFN